MNTGRKEKRYLKQLGSKVKLYLHQRILEEEFVFLLLTKNHMHSCSI